MFCLRTTARTYKYGRQIKGKVPATTTPCLQSNETTCTVFVPSSTPLPPQDGLLQEQVIISSGTDILIAQLQEQVIISSGTDILIAQLTRQLLRASAE